VPVITAHVDDLFLAERVLSLRHADFIAFGRQFLADPEFPLKAEEGRFEDIRPCIRCNWSLLPDSANKWLGGGTHATIFCIRHQFHNHQDFPLPITTKHQSMMLWLQSAWQICSSGCNLPGKFAQAVFFINNAAFIEYYFNDFRKFHQKGLGLS